MNEETISVGDTVWVKHPTQQYKILTGKVMKINDISTQIQHKDGSTITYPNSSVSAEYEKLNPNPYKRPKQGLSEGTSESYIIVRTNSEGKKDVFAGNFDSYERAQKELDACLAHPLHTKHKQKFEIKKKSQGLSEESNPEYDDEAGMADNNLETLKRAVEGIDDLIKTGDNLPEWCQEKIAVAKSTLVSVWDYMKSEEHSEQVAEGWKEKVAGVTIGAAALGGIGAGIAYSPMAYVNGQQIHMASPGSIPDNAKLVTDDSGKKIYVWQTSTMKGRRGFVYRPAEKQIKEQGVAEDWQKVNKKDKTDGMSPKAVKAYRKENPGSKLKTAVTKKPSELKAGSKDANRRKSFCARMGGAKKNASAETRNNPDSPVNKALRRWNCESVEQLEHLVMLAEQHIRNNKKLSEISDPTLTSYLGKANADKKAIDKKLDKLKGN